MCDIIHWIAIFGGFIFGVLIFAGLMILVIILVLGSLIDKRKQKFQEDSSDYERRFK